MRHALVFRILRTSAVLIAVGIFPIRATAAPQQVGDVVGVGALEQRLRDQYENKTFVLRGFNHGVLLTYDAGGLPAVGSANKGDWMDDGFIRVTSLSLSTQRLTIKAQRLYLMVGGGGFHLEQPEIKQVNHGDNIAEIRIELAVEPSDTSAERTASVLSRIFLTSQDHIEEFVPDYWKPCVLAASTDEGTKACRFPPEFDDIPGVGDQTSENPKPEEGGRASGGSDSLEQPSDPRVISQVDPEFSEKARAAGHQGLCVLRLIVEPDGTPSNIRVIGKLGMGLDEKAVEAVRKWRFQPSVIRGHPVRYGPVEVDVDFHLYQRPR